MENSCYEIGQKAFKDGVSVEDNPYVTYGPFGSRGGDDADDWSQGWWDAYDSSKES